MSVHPIISALHGILVGSVQGGLGLLAPFYQWDGTGTERFFDQPKVTQPGSSSFPWDPP